LDDLEELKTINFIEKRIKIWWEKPESIYHINGVHLSPKRYLLNSTDILSNNIKNIYSKLSEINKSEIQYQEKIKNLSDTISKIQITVDNLTVDNEKLKNEIGRLKDIFFQQEIKSDVSPISSVSIEDIKISSVSTSADSIIKIFNDWAREPESNLPPQFSFANGELKLREEQDITETDNSDSLWIINKSGTVKYLFPNPNAIDEIGGNVDTIYKVTGTRKAKGHNKVTIIKPCEINDEGYIPYKGELSLL